MIGLAKIIAVANPVYCRQVLPVNLNSAFTGLVRPLYIGIHIQVCQVNMTIIYLLTGKIYQQAEHS